MAKKVILLGYYGTGGASNYRIALWEKGLIEEGINVRVFYLVRKASNKIFTHIQILFQLFKLLFFSSKNIFWIYGYVPDIVYLILKKKGFIIERNEYPYHLIQSGYNRRQDLKNFYKKVTHFITCSDALVDYYSQFTKKNCRFLKSNLLVDFDKYSSVKVGSPLDCRRYVAYCGFMGNNKDGVFDLLDAFKIFIEKNNRINLCLIGTASDEEMKKIKRYADILGLKESVLFTGYVNHEKIPAYLYHSEALLLARPNNKQAEGGFPSKLGEYLSTGNPVLVTSVGEIPNYIKDGKNGFIVQPDNPKIFAEKLSYIINNKVEAKKVGQNGQLLAKNEFDYRKHVKDVIKFLNL